MLLLGERGGERESERVRGRKPGRQAGRKEEDKKEEKGMRKRREQSARLSFSTSCPNPGSRRRKGGLGACHGLAKNEDLPLTLGCSFCSKQKAI